MRDLELWNLVAKLERDQIPHALATVVKVRGSASAKTGSKALISSEGKNLWGWVGGGCAEAYVITESLEALKDGIPRTIIADLDDEVFGLGMPCGGIMEIFIEPKLSPEKLSFSIARSPALDRLLDHFGFVAKNFGSMPETRINKILRAIAESLCINRGISYQSILEARNKRLPFAPLPEGPSEFLILGHSRITEELAKLGVLLQWPTRVYGLNLEKANYPANAQALAALPEYAGLEIKPKSYVIIASHHKGDAEYIRLALDAQASFIGMVASEKRANIVMDYLKAKNHSAEKLEKVRSPAGIDLHCKNPGEIALSIIAELIT